MADPREGEQRRAARAEARRAARTSSAAGTSSGRRAGTWRRAARSADHGSVHQHGCGQADAEYSWYRQSVAWPSMENTATMMTAALVTTPALLEMPPVTASSPAPRDMQFPDPGQDEHVVVHAQPEQEHEHEQQYPRDDSAEGRVAEQPLQPAVLEDQRDQSISGADHSRSSMIEISGMVTERNAAISSRNASTATKAKTIGALASTAAVSS